MSDNAPTTRDDPEDAPVAPVVDEQEQNAEEQEQTPEQQEHEPEIQGKPEGGEVDASPKI